MTDRLRIAIPLFPPKAGDEVMARALEYAGQRR
jgi:hypothetical protein